MNLSGKYWILISLLCLTYLMMTGCLKTDLLEVKPCEEKETAGQEKNIVMLVGEDNQRQMVTVTQVKYPGEEASDKGPCQTRVKQTCILGLGCFND